MTFSTAYRLFWVVLVALGIVAGTLLGLSLFGVGVAPTTAVLAVMLTGGLAGTLFVAGRPGGLETKYPRGRRKKDDE